jgi:hypothetical protein
MMKGKLYRRNKDGYIYEVIEDEHVPGLGIRWTLWNDRAGERQFAMEIELVGTAADAEPQEEPAQEMPAALMK